MTGNTPKGGGKSPRDAREERLKAALKSNMGRRKAQARARKSEASPDVQDQAPTQSKVKGTE